MESSFFQLRPDELGVVDIKASESEPVARAPPDGVVVVQATPEMIRGYAAASRLPEWDAALLGVLRDGSRNALTQPIAEIVSRAGAPIPTLILWGADDGWVPLSAGESLRDALPAARYVVLPGLGHVPFEEDPEAFSQAMQEWLAALK